jgi:hypothetical protein
LALRADNSASALGQALAELQRRTEALQTLRAKRQLLPLARVEFIERAQGLCALLQAQTQAQPRAQPPPQP